MPVAGLLEKIDVLDKTPFHYLSSALGEITSILIKLDKDGYLLHQFLTKCDENRHTVLHRACIEGDTATLNAIHNCIKFLKQESGEQIWDKEKFKEILCSQDKDGKTALHHSCEQGSSKNVKTLLEIANVHGKCFEEMVGAKDNCNKTCLYFLHKADNDLLEALMKAITTHDTFLIKQNRFAMPFVENQAGKISSEIPLLTRKKQSSYLPMQADPLSVLLTYALLTHKDGNDRTPLSYVDSRQKDKCVDFLTPFYEVLKQKVRRTDPKLKINLDSKDGRAKVIGKISCAEYVLFDSQGEDMSYREKSENSLLTAFGQENCLALINHNYTQCYLIKCWRSYGRYFFYTNFFLYLTFVLLLTTFVISHREENSSKEHSRNYASQINVSGNVTDNSLHWPHYRHQMISSLSNSKAFAIMISLISILLLVWEGIQFAAKRTHYWNSKENVADMVVCVGVLVLAIGCSINGYCAWNHIQWTALVILAWFKVAWLMTKIPKYTSRNLEVIGRKFLMLFKVMENVVKFLPVLILFTGTFSFGFYCLFSQDDEFNQFEYSTLKTITLAIGEFEFRDLFLESQTPGYHYIPGCILVLILFAVMTISAMNLLVAIAIGEFRELKDKSEAIAFLILVDQIFECQEVMKLIQKCFNAKSNKFPNDHIANHAIEDDTHVDKNTDLDNDIDEDIEYDTMPHSDDDRDERINKTKSQLVLNDFSNLLNACFCNSFSYFINLSGFKIN